MNFNAYFFDFQTLCKSAAPQLRTSTPASSVTSSSSTRSLWSSLPSKRWAKLKKTRQKLNWKKKIVKLTDHPSTYNDLTNFESEVSAHKERKRKLWQSVETCLEKNLWNHIKLKIGAHSKAGNGSYLNNLHNLAWKNSWNHIRWTYFRRI